MRVKVWMEIKEKNVDGEGTEEPVMIEARKTTHNRRAGRMRG